MKNLNVAIQDSTDKKLSEINDVKQFKNRADLVDWLICEMHKALLRGDVEVDVSGG